MTGKREIGFLASLACVGDCEDPGPRANIANLPAKHLNCYTVGKKMMALTARKKRLPARRRFELLDVKITSLQLKHTLYALLNYY